MSVSEDDERLRSALFRPNAIVLIGQSDNPCRPAGRPLAFLRQAGYPGQVWPVNPRRDTVQGERAYPSLSALPATPDHAYILLGSDLAVQAVRDCAAAGVTVATVLADGFAEAGPQGARRQAEIVAAAQSAGMRLLGPNSMGLADLHGRLHLTVNAIYAEEEQKAGRIALISQSGSMMGGLISRAKALGIGFSKVVAVGNEADLGTGEIGRLCVDDPDTSVFLLFLEAIRDADAMARFAAAAHQAGKPVIAYLPG